MVHVAQETSLAIENTLLDSSDLVHVRCRNHHGPGFWSDWSSPYNLSLGGRSRTVTYVQYVIFWKKPNFPVCFVWWKEYLRVCVLRGGAVHMSWAEEPGGSSFPFCFSFCVALPKILRFLLYMTCTEKVLN